MGCILSSQLRRHEAQQDALEAKDEAIDARAKELILPGEDCYPFSADNFFEALMDDALAEFSEKINFLDDLQVGIEIRRVVEKYWEQKAQEIAENE